MKIMKFKNFLGATVAATVLLVGACKKTETEVNGSATLRIVNAYDGSSPQDFYQDDNKLASGVVYGSASSKTIAQTGSRTLKFTNAGSAQANASITVALNMNSSSTVFYNKKADGTGEVLGYEESNSPMANGKFAVRFINLGSSLTSTIDVEGGAVGNTLASALALKSVTNYTVLDVGSSVTFRLTGSLTSVVIPSSEFESGKTYTVWFDAASTTTARYHVLTQN